MFSCEFCEISKTNFFKEQLWATTSLCSICILCPGGGCRFPRIVSFRLSKISLFKFFFVNSLFQLVWIKFQAREYVDNNYFTAINVILKSLKVSKLQWKWSFTFTSWIIDFTSICYSWCIGTMDRWVWYWGKKGRPPPFLRDFLFLFTLKCCFKHFALNNLQILLAFKKWRDLSKQFLLVTFLKKRLNTRISPRYVR